MDMQNIITVFSQINFRSAAWMLLLPLAFIAFDLITGFAQAWIHSEIQSRVMRIGIVHKALEIGIIALFWIVKAALYIEVRHWWEDPRAWIAGYYCLMEAISIAENLNKAGVWVPKFLLHRMKEAKEAIDEGSISLGDPTKNEDEQRTD